MIREILTLLSNIDAYNISEEIEIAKGKYSIPKTFKESIKQMKREVKFKKK